MTSSFHAILQISLKFHSYLFPICGPAFFQLSHKKKPTTNAVRTVLQNPFLQFIELIEFNKAIIFNYILCIQTNNMNSTYSKEIIPKSMITRNHTMQFSVSHTARLMR